MRLLVAFAGVLVLAMASLALARRHAGRTLSPLSPIQQEAF